VGDVTVLGVIMVAACEACAWSVTHMHARHSPFRSHVLRCKVTETWYATQTEMQGKGMKGAYTATKNKKIVRQKKRFNVVTYFASHLRLQLKDKV
jgi:hypothetical protein